MSVTEGPWESKPWTTGGGRINAGIVFEKLHLFITSHNPNYSDDARLVESAPAMLDELRRVVEYLDTTIADQLACDAGNFDGGSAANCEHCRMIGWLNRIDSLIQFIDGDADVSR